MSLANLNYVFNPKSVAIVGATNKQGKIGKVVLDNFLTHKYEGELYFVNIKYSSLLGRKCYHKVSDIPGQVDLAIIITPAKTVLGILEDCGKKGVKGAVVLTSGFGEIGNKTMEKQLVDIANKYNIALVGPNCLGIYASKSKIDTIFMPIDKAKRPKQGKISIITQSGSTGTSIMDVLAEYNLGVSKFVSYGNGSVLDESDYLLYLGNDKDTDIIIMYLEGTRNGKKLFSTLKNVVKKKPVIILKSGRVGKATQAAKSHTGNIAGDYLAYHACFKQSGAIEANNITELINFAKIFLQPLPDKNGKVGIITNGGGMGILSADACISCGLPIADISPENVNKIKSILPAYGNVGNPLDIIADADVERYKKAISFFMEDKNIDIILVSVLFQVPSIDDSLLAVIENFSKQRKKPIAVITFGSSFTEEKRKVLESKGIPTYRDPYECLKSVKVLVNYSKFLHNQK